ncbi:MAG: putative transport system permease protein [Gaiellaceae bacterium]|nr:putative transport system permease protein [Gaiellaceae bacterium]
MRTLAAFALAGLARAPRRTAVRLVTLAAAAALLGAMILFVGHSLTTMTAATTRSVPIDWQGPVGSYDAATRLATAVAGQPRVRAALPVATAPFQSVEHRAPVGTIRSGSGAFLAVPPGYLRQFSTFRFLRGGLREGQIVFDQQLAATLQVQPGDTVSVTVRPGAAPRRFKVSGIALVGAGDLLFQPLNPLAGPAAAQPPANVAILPLATFARTVAVDLPAASAATPGAAAVPGVPAGVGWQVDARVDSAALTGSPAHALRQATQLRNVAERSLTGRIQFVDNLGEALTGASGDALYAETLFIMLAVPGGLAALLLVYLAALGTATRDRRELALLRARGATRRSLLALALVESIALGAVAGPLGAGLALLALRRIGSAGGIDVGRALLAVAVCAAFAIGGALAARTAAIRGVLGESVAAGRRGYAASRKPLWQRLWLDVLALVLSGLVYWLTLRTGFSAVVNPDSNPTLSLSVYMFFAPALLWLGASLLVVRLRGRAVAWLAGRGARGDTLRSFVLASASRRGEALNRGILVLGLLLAFAVSLAIFSSTYDQQARIDAQLTLGADVAVTTPPGALVQRGIEARVAQLPGVRGTTAVAHSYAYVGPDLQDTFGVDPATLTRGTTLRDSYFLGGTARQTMAALAAHPDGILVSKETITDYSLALGDLLKLRVLDRSTGGFRVVPFHVVGIVQEFPSAPRDSFMVANIGYLERRASSGGANVLFVRTSGDPHQVAGTIASATRADGAAVRDIRQQAAQTTSSITTVDLSGISRIEEEFAIALAALAAILWISLTLAERRVELATMRALGASLREVGAFLWSEVLLVVAASIGLAALLGWLLAEMLVAMLTHVFDPPPDHLAAPWPFLAALGLATIVAALGAVVLGLAWVRRMPLGAILREQ